MGKPSQPYREYSLQKRRPSAYVEVSPSHSNHPLPQNALYASRKLLDIPPSGKIVSNPWNWPKTKEKSESLSSPKLCVAPSYRSKIMLKVARGYLLSSLLLAIVKVKFVYLRDSCRAGAVTSASE